MKSPVNYVFIGIVAATASLFAATQSAHSQSLATHGEEAQDFVHGAPASPTDTWLLAAGGRIYDKWWDALDRDEPMADNPAYPEVGQKSGSNTWRCKTCHGWDYRGAGGIYGEGSSYFTGIPGIDGAVGRDVGEIMALLRDDNHPYTQEMIADHEMVRVAAFVSRGQVDMRPFIDTETRTVNGGDAEAGAHVFQTTCAACHGFDGRLLDWGGADGPAYVGSEGVDVPDEVMHKIMNAHTGVQMINLRAFPLEYAINVLAYTATLPTE